MVNDNPIERLIKIFDILKTEYNVYHECEDEQAFKNMMNWAEMEDADIKILDYSFVLNVCFGPWRPERQKDVWQTAYKIFKEDCKGDLRNATDSVDMGFQLDWQKKRIIKMSKFLNNNKLSFTEFIKGTENMNGLTVRGEFKRIFRAVTTKTRARGDPHLGGEPLIAGEPVYRDDLRPDEHRGEVVHPRHRHQQRARRFWRPMK